MGGPGAVVSGTCLFRQNFPTTRLPRTKMENRKMTRNTKCGNPISWSAFITYEPLPCFICLLELLRPVSALSKN